MEKRIFYYDSDVCIERAIVLEIGRINSEEQIMNLYSEGLNFPSYFGRNWDALYDCLCDLWWIDGKEIYIIHKRVLSLSNKDMLIYIDTLFDVVFTWMKYPVEHIVKVYFHPEDEVYIERLLRKIERKWDNVL